jgi:hypothetical protein
MKSKSHFKEPNAIKKQERDCKPKDGVGITWDFSCPQYDQRSGPWINAGTNYGKGINQPVGHKGNPKSKVEVLPYGRHPTMDSDEVI